MFCMGILVSTNEPLQIFGFFKPLSHHEPGLKFGLEAKKPGLGLGPMGKAVKNRENACSGTRQTNGRVPGYPLSPPPKKN